MNQDTDSQNQNSLPKQPPTGEQIALSEEQFRAFVTATSDAVYQMSADWQQMHLLVGKSFLPDTKTTNSSWLQQYIPPSDQALVQATIEQAIATKSLFKLTHRVIRADGSLGWTFSQAIPILDPQGAICHWFGMANDVTGQKQAQEILTQSEQKYRTLFNSIDEGVTTVELILDQAGRAVDFVYLDHNPALTRQTGLTADIIGRRVSQVIPALEPFWLERYGRVVNTGEPERFEYGSIDLDALFEVYVSRVGGSDSRTLVIVYSNITERKRREASLAFLADISQDLVKMSQPEQTLDLLGEKICRHFNTIRSLFVEIIDNEQKAIVWDWHRPGLRSTAGEVVLSQFVAEPFYQQCRSGETVRIDNVHQSDLVDGQQIEAVFGVQAFLLVPLLRNGHWVYTLGVHSDQPRHWQADEIDLLQELVARIWARLEKARAEEALHASQKRFELIANLVPDLLWESQPDGATSWYSQRWLEYTGQRLEEAIDRGWVDAIHPDDRAASAQRYGEAVVAGQSLRQEHRIRRHDGAYRWFVVSTVPLLDERGQVVTMYGAATDIHQSKCLEDSLLEADRRKDEFLAMLAHELRNPLAPIHNGLQLLAQTHQDDQLMGTMLPIMNRQMDHLMRMVDDLLDVSRISRGRIELRKEPIDLTHVVSQAVGAMRPMYLAAGRQLNAQLPNQPLYLIGDPTRLNQVTTNLLTNGLRYTPEGGQVWITLQQLGEQAVLRVRDNGIGLAPEHLKAIFDLFVQVDTSLARSHGGLGLGLSLVQELVQLHGGRVEAHSQGLEQGSEFVVYLPISSAPSPTTYEQ